MIHITPIAQDNKGRFNRRGITITAKDNESVFIGLTDTGKKVAVHVLGLETYKGQLVCKGSLLVAVQYQADFTNNMYGRKSNWGNWYQITSEEFEQITKIK